MESIPVIYWSGTGNTEAMAIAVSEGIIRSSASVNLCQVDGITSEEAASAHRLALGCPSMGCEELEESEFEPFFSQLEGHLNGKTVVLFGSYGWGSGEWMDLWRQRVEDAGGQLCADPVIANYAPDEDALAQCRSLGQTLARS